VTAAPAVGARRLFGAAGAGVLLSGLIVNIYLAIVARSLSPAEYAGFGAFWGIVLCIGFGAFLPLEQVLAHQLPRPQDRAALLRAATGAAIALAGLSIVVLTALSWVVLPALDGNVSSFAALAALCVVSAGQFLLRGTLIGTDRLVRHGAVMVLDAVLRLGTAVTLFVIGGATATAFCWALVGAMAVAHVPLLPGAWRRAVGQAPPAQAPRASVGSLLRAVAPLLAGSVCAQLLLNGLPVMVVAQASRPADQAAAGIFVAAFTLARAPLAAVVPLQSAVVPTMTRLIANGRRGALALGLLRGTAVLGGVALVGLPLVWWLGPPVIRLVLGPAYRIPAPDLVLIMAGVLAYIALVVLTQVHVARGRPVDVALSWAVALGAAALSYLLAPGPVLNAEIAFLAGSAAGALASGVVLVSARARAGLARRGNR
jgi:O-antigen/teichoic acid export membrane protein